MHSSIRRFAHGRLMALCDRLGFALLPKWRIDGLPMARHLGELFRLLEVDCVLDVGANLGQYCGFLRNELGYHGPIISFEPIRQNVLQLREQAQSDPTWQIENCALGSENTELYLNVMKRHQFSSFLAPTNTSVNEFASMNTVEARQLTRVRRLDDWIAEQGAKFNFRRLYLKLDTQGFDLRVFEGSRKVLNRIVALQSEISCIPIYENSPHFTESIRVYQQAGFDISDMFAVTHDRMRRAVEFDCIMLNRCLLSGAS
jgi:FkbM family methyltransferase